jgi:hypothetical protein
MAGLRFSVSTSEINTGTTKVTLLQILAAANHRVKVSEIRVSFQGIVNTDAPILVEIARQSTTPAGSDSVTPEKLDPGYDETIQTSAAELFDGTNQPTETSIVDSELVHPQTGWGWQAPKGDEIIVPGGGRLGLAVTAAVAVDAVARFVVEE